MQDAETFWDKAAEKYAKSPIKNMPAYRQTMERTRSHLRKTHDVLEVGCGTGSTALLLAKSVNHITASDISSNMIGIAKYKASTQGVQNVRFMHENLLENKHEEGSFDVILAFNLLHLLKDRRAAVRRIHDLLKPGGLFISKSVCLAEKIGLLRLLVYAMQKLGRAPHVDFLKIQDLDDTIANGDFQIIETGLYPSSPPSRFVVAKRM